MTIETFNQLSLMDKAAWLKEQINGKKIGLCNDLVLKDRVIFFLFSYYTKELIQVDASPLPPELIAEVNAKCIKEKLDSFIIIHDTDPAYKNRVFEAIQSVNNQMN